MNSDNDLAYLICMIVLGALCFIYLNQESKECKAKGGVYLVNEYKCVTGIKELK